MANTRTTFHRKRQNTTSRQLIIIGNGFDLQCKMKTRYQDFFDYRFGIALQNKINKYEKNNSNARTDFIKVLTKKLLTYFVKTIERPTPFTFIRLDEPPNLPSQDKTKEKLQINLKVQLFLKDYFQTIKNQILSQVDDESIKEKFLKELNSINSLNYSKWDTVFLLANCFLSKDSLIQWNDIEHIIFKIVSLILADNKEASDFTFNTSDEKYYFISGIKNCFKGNKGKDTLAISMLDSLRIFEDNFATYIDKIKLQNASIYYKKSFKLLNALMHVQENNIVDILSFNYSLDKSFLEIYRRYFDNEYDNQKKLIINSWSNIHGIAAYKNTTEKDWILSQSIKTINQDIKLPAPIFGIDNHDILKADQNGDIDFNDPRSIFTKSFRLLDNHVNNIRLNTFQNKVDVITFYGHSLSQADYSYFESVFDQYDIFHSDVKLEFYYYQGNDGKETTAKNNERKTMKAVVKLLTSYGTTLKNEHGENIVNKLILEQRLTVLPTPLIFNKPN